MNKQQLKDAIAAEQKRHADVMKDLTSKLRVFELEESARTRKSYEDRKELLEKTGVWLNKSQVLKVGDLVQVTGSRAGKYRQIVAINKWSIVGIVVHQKRTRTPNGPVLSWVKDVSKVTDQGFNKVTHVFRDGEFIHVKVLMEQENEVV